MAASVCRSVGPRQELTDKQAVRRTSTPRTALTTVQRTGSLEATRQEPEGERSHSDEVFASEKAPEPSRAEVSLPVQPGLISAARRQLRSVKGFPRVCSSCIEQSTLTR